MRFYNNTHPYYCGIDLHARSLYVCIIDNEGNILRHREIPAKPDRLKQLLEPYIGNIVVGVECTAGIGSLISANSSMSISFSDTPST